MLGKKPPFITSDTLNLDLVDLIGLEIDLIGLETDLIGLEIELIGLEIVLKAARLELNVALLAAGGTGLVRGRSPSGMICMRKSVPAWGLLTVIMSLIISISSLGELEGIDKRGRLEATVEEDSGETVERRMEKEVAGEDRVGEGGVFGCCCCCCCFFRSLGVTSGGSVPIASVGSGILHGVFEPAPG